MKVIAIIICVILCCIALYNVFLLFRDIRRKVKHKNKKKEE